MLGSLKSEVRLVLALHTLETKHDLLRGLSLLVEHWLGLATISLLLTVVTALSCADREGDMSMHISIQHQEVRRRFALNVSH